MWAASAASLAEWMGRASLRAARCVRGPVLCYAVKGCPRRGLGGGCVAWLSSGTRAVVWLPKAVEPVTSRLCFAAALELKTLFRSVFADSASEPIESLWNVSSRAGTGPRDESHIRRRAAQQLANLALSGACGGLLVVGVLCRCPAGCGQRACTYRASWAASSLVPVPLWAPCARRRGPRARRRPGPTRGPRRRRRGAPGRRRRRRRTTRRRSPPPSRRRRRRRRRRAGRRRRWPRKQGSRPWRHVRRT